MGQKRKPNWVAGALFLVVHVLVARLTWRDIAVRPDAQVRGPKPFWRVASALNTGGSVAYWVLGRRTARSIEESARRKVR